MNDSEQHVITVSVIDDDPLVCQAMSMIARDYSQGRVSVRAPHQPTEPPPCETPTANTRTSLLVDVAMPGIDGIETTRRLRALRNPPHVLILTSLNPSNTVERSVEADAGFVSKTDAPEDIIRRIVGICEGTPQFNPASQRQAHQSSEHAAGPSPRRDEARALLDTLPSRERRSRAARRRRLHQRRDRRTHVHIGTHRESASLQCRGQTRHGARADGTACRTSGPVTAPSRKSPPAHPYRPAGTLMLSSYR